MLVIVVVTVPLFTPHFGNGARGIAIAVTLAVSAVAWAIWQFAGDRPRLWLATLAVMGAAGGALAGLSSLSTAVAVGFVVAVSAGARLSAEVSLGDRGGDGRGVPDRGARQRRARRRRSSAGPPGSSALWAFGLTRRAYLLRAVEAEQALEQARRAHAAETQAAALAERARIAREIHDVLAHALAAVSVNLQAAEGLLDAVPDKGPELAKVVECVERAGALTKEGMAETRRAILALRDDVPGARAGYAAQATRPAAARPADCPVPPSRPPSGSPPGCARWPMSTAPPATRRSSSRSTGTPRPLGADARADRLPDGAGGAHQRAQARAGPAGQPRASTTRPTT